MRGYLKPILVALVGGGALFWYFWGNTQNAVLQSRVSQMDSSDAWDRLAAIEHGPKSFTSTTPTAQPSQSRARPSTPFALSPGKLSLGDTAQDVLARSDGPQALRLGRILTECLTTGAREVGIELQRTYPTRDVAFDSRLLKELSDQLARIKSECQTVPGNHKDLVIQLAELAYSQQVPGAAQMLLSLHPDRATRSLLERLASDARGGEWLSVMSASVGQQVPVSETERTEMLLALQRAYQNTQPLGSDYARMYRRVIDRVWSAPESGGLGAMNVPQSGGLPSPGTTALPRSVVTPTDPQALARIEQLTAQLTRQVKEMVEEREAARRRAAGG